jgi:preprotein translocase subunit YajC
MQTTTYLFLALAIMILVQIRMLAVENKKIKEMLDSLNQLSVDLKKFSNTAKN